jgi:hypothetical protein
MRALVQLWERDADKRPRAVLRRIRICRTAGLFAPVRDGDALPEDWVGVWNDLDDLLARVE